MSDETPDVTQAPEVEGTPEQTQQDNWEKRYSDLQPEYTRATQEAAQLRQQAELYQTLLSTDDPDTRREAAQALGIELADDEAEDTQFDDPYLTREEWAKYQKDMRDQQNAAQAAQREQQQLENIGNFIDKTMDELGVDESDKEWIFQKAALGDGIRQADGSVMPDVQGAIDAMNARDLDAKKRWAKTKRTQHFPSGGGEGTHTLGDDAQHSDRVQFMLSKLADQE